MRLTFRITVSHRIYMATRVAIVAGFVLILGVIIVSPHLGGTAGSAAESGSASPRATLAQQTIRRYWYDIQHHQGRDEYALLSPKIRASVSLPDFSQGWAQYMKQFGPLFVTVERARVRGHYASVPITLHIARYGVMHFYHHLVWSHGGWLISDKDGTLSDNP